MTTIDLGPLGPRGIEARYWITNGTLYMWVRGSDHKADWLHHILPGAARREHEAAYQLAAMIRGQTVQRYVIGGHSLGGAVACLVAVLLAESGAEVECYTFGGKRAPWKWEDVDVVHYRHRGDIVPFLPPWRTPHAEEVLIGRWTWPWKAHGPETYDYVRKGHGLK